MSSPLRLYHVRAGRAAAVIGGLLILASTARESVGQGAAASRKLADTTCAACRDFYGFANRAWLDTATIPAGHPAWGAFEINAARVAAQLRQLLDSAATVPPNARPPVGRFYSGCLDSTAADAAGLDPLASSLAAINAMHDAADVARVLGRLQREGVAVLFRFTSDVDRTGAGHYLPMIMQGGLGLPDQRVYALEDSGARALRDAYVEHIARTFALAGQGPDEAAQNARHVLAFETVLARASMSRAAVANADAAMMYHRISWGALRDLTPGFAWDAFVQARVMRPADSVIVSQPAFLRAVAGAVRERPMSEWRAYFMWHLLADAEPWLTAPFVDEHYRFVSRLSGVSARPPRWQRCVDETNADLQELVGHAYVDRFFSASSKKRIQALVDEIRAVLLERLRTVPWLTDASRQQALAKAGAFRVKIGYPDQWHDYSALTIPNGPFISQREAAKQFEADRLMARIGRTPDPAQWDFHDIYHLLPQSPTDWANWNEIIFPAAALQPPFFDSAADPATNYGAIGTIIGHEMTHLFTADGGSIDGSGAIRRWWTSADSIRFARIERRVVAQYDQDTVLDAKTHVNGKLTLDENLADLGGVELAYAALERSLDRTPRAAGADTTPEQHFFLGYARLWSEKSTPASARLQLATDGHAPDPVRAIVPLEDFRPFRTAFHCRVGDPMASGGDSPPTIW